MLYLIYFYYYQIVIIVLSYYVTVIMTFSILNSSSQFVMISRIHDTMSKPGYEKQTRIVRGSIQLTIRFFTNYNYY